jgi:hypothetical protein
MHDLNANSPWVLQCSRCHEAYPRIRFSERRTASTPITSTEEGSSSPAGGAAPKSAGTTGEALWQIRYKDWHAKERERDRRWTR